MKDNKVVATLKDAIVASGLRDGMTISFHHHLRNGDFVLNMVLEQVAALGIRDITVNASSLFDIHLPLVEQIRNGVVTGLETDYVSAGFGRELSRGVLANPVIFRSHGGRPADIALGRSPIDVAFIAAPAADPMGNATGRLGQSACGSLGYAVADAIYSKKTVVITDCLMDYPLPNAAIQEGWVDYVVAVEQIGDPKGIVSGTTKITRDPVGLAMASLAARAIEHCGLLKDGFSFQTGAGGASLAAAQFLKEIMLREQIAGSFALGGITGYIVDMMKAGCFRNILDVQCFDLEAVRSIREDPRHQEISAERYASPNSLSAAVDSLDVVILGATEVDLDFNVNVHTDSNGVIMGGSGGHCDAAAGAKITMIIAPLIRARLPLISNRVTCISTPGTTVDLLVTQKGIAVNPARPQLAQRLREGGLPIREIAELKAMAERLTGIPNKPPRGNRVLAQVLYRDGTHLDDILDCPVEK